MAEQSMSVPVVACPTSYGVAEPPTTTVPPPSTVVALPASLTGHVALYRDASDTMQLLAPSGWYCSAGYGADGSGGVQVFPPGSGPPASGVGQNGGTAVPFTASSAQGVVGIETSACNGCAEAQACPLFSVAAHDMEDDLGRGCPEAKPDAEEVEDLSPSAVQFQDQTGVAGDGVPSGGPYVARGLMTYKSHDVDGSWLETCTLPAADAELCAASLQEFFGAYGSR